MIEKRIDLSDFKKDTSFYGTLEGFITIKSFDLQAIRARYLASKKNNKTGSVERRKVSEGGIAYFKIENGKMTNCEVLVRCKEPRGVDFHNGQLAFSTENSVTILDGNQRKQIKDDWFSYVHTVSFSPDGSHLLVSSSGFDVIFEYNLKTMSLAQDWWAWENGFSHGKDPVTGEKVVISRAPVANAGDATRNLVIDNPKEQHLPTALRTAFINSIEYDQKDPSKWLGTFFHEGAIFSIDPKSGDNEKVLDGLTNPHGGQSHNDGILATDTRGGAVVFQEKNEKSIYDFSNIEGKPEGLENQEWIQNSKVIKDHVISIDSNRNQFVIFDRHNQILDTIDYDDNWAVQDMVVFPEANPEEIRKLINALSNE